jgi:CubicO group peptidase (beta-lactamase class C family)
MAEELERLTRAGLAYPPGSQWAYSTSMDVLGAALEVADGRPLDALMEKHITAPLGASSIRFDPTPQQRDTLVAAYADGKPAPLRIPDAGHCVPFPEGVPLYAGLAGINLVPARVFDAASFRSSGAGMIGTAGDMLAFIEAMRMGGAPILSADSAHAMMTVQTGALPIPSRGPGWAFGFGGAILIDPQAAASPQSPGTFGWGGVWGHTWFTDPVRRISMVSLTNTALEGMMGRYTRDLRNAIYADV